MTCVENHFERNTSNESTFFFSDFIFRTVPKPYQLSTNGLHRNSAPTTPVNNHLTYGSVWYLFTFRQCFQCTPQGLVVGDLVGQVLRYLFHCLAAKSKQHFQLRFHPLEDLTCLLLQLLSQLHRVCTLASFDDLDQFTCDRWRDLVWELLDISLGKDIGGHGLKKNIIYYYVYSKFCIRDGGSQEEVESFLSDWYSN